YIYNIAKLVEWHDPGARTGPFIIGILGSDNLYQELVKKYAMRSIGKQPIEVRKLPMSAEVDRCHILFLPRSARALLPALLRREQTRSTLIISDYPQALSEGAVVNFVSADNTLKYEISLVNAKKHDLDIGLTLKQLADRVVE
ncbi:MAG: YfiR family protein, partial [Flavobacteriales bacterium]